VRAMFSRWRLALLIVSLTVGSAGWPAAAFAQPPQPAQDEFVPIDQLPADEKLPAARFLIAAYAVAWVAVVGYLWSILRRLGRVEREIADVRRRIQQPGGR
jgi:CcmD family protein